jgi:hypothetical protein
MRKTRNVSVAAVAAVLATTVAFAGCGRPTEGSKTEEGSRIAAAMGRVETFSLASTLTDNYTVVLKTGRNSDTWLWQAQTTVDVAKNAANVSMNATDVACPSVTPYRWELYLIGGWQYYSQTSPAPGGMTNPWMRRKLDDSQRLFSNSVQVTPQVELIDTAAKLNAVGSEVIDGLKCDVLDFSPTADAASDWVLSRETTGSGPSMWWWKTGPARSKEIYVKAYAGGSAKFWIDHDSSRIVQADVDLHFVVKPGNAKRSDTGLGTDSNTSESDLGFEEIIRDFHGQLHFSGYGQPLSVLPPAEALAAPSY